VTDQSAKDPRITADCDGVTDREPIALDEETVWTA
jgi:hypothetical protein